MAAGAQNLFQKSNVGLGAGVRPTAANISGPSGFHPKVEAQGLMVHQNDPIIANNTEMLQLQEQYDTQEAIRQKNLEKLAELRGIQDLNAGGGSISGGTVGEEVGQFKAVGPNPLGFGDDYLKKMYFEGLYP